MAIKTYVPGLRLILRQIIKYISRYQDVLSASLSTEAYTCLIDTLTAAQSCLALVPAPEKGD